VERHDGRPPQPFTRYGQGKGRRTGVAVPALVQVRPIDARSTDDAVAKDDTVERLVIGRQFELQRPRLPAGEDLADPLREELGADFVGRILGVFGEPGAAPCPVDRQAVEVDKALGYLERDLFEV